MLSVVVLAAGKGTRMRSDLPKVLHPLLGVPLLDYPLELAEELAEPEGAEQIYLIPIFSHFLKTMTFLLLQCPLEEY